MQSNPLQKDLASYQIKVSGNLDSRWTEWFNGAVSNSQQENKDGETLTVFTATIPDQAALRGLLNRIWNLNLTLISITRLEEIKQPPNLQGGQA